MGITEQLASFAVETDLSQIPETVVAEAKVRILDTIAVMTVGSQFEAARIAAGFAEGLGSRPESGLVGNRVRAASPYAAFANGVASHSPEFDDTWIGSNFGGGNHISSCVLPAALAIGEARGSSGSDVLLAYIVGYEVAARLGLPPRPDLLGGILQGYHPTPLLAVFGSGMAGAKLLDLDVDQARFTLGLIGSEGGGMRKQAGTMGKAFQAGHASRNGVVAALLAARGMTADPDVLEGVPGTGHDHFGYFETHIREGNYELEAATQDLGSRWEFMYTITKLHPGYIHAASVDLTLDMVKEHDIKPEQIEKVEVGVTSIVNLGPTYRYPGPSSGRRALRPMIRARISGQALLGAPMAAYSGCGERDGGIGHGQWYTLGWLAGHIAICILERKAGLMQFTDERASRADVRPLIEKIEFYVDDECEEDYRSGRVPFGSSGKVTFHMKDGRKISRKEGTRPGYLDNPATWDDIMAKFRECADYSGLSDRGLSVDRVAELVNGIDRLTKAEELMNVLAV